LVEGGEWVYGFWNAATAATEWIPGEAGAWGWREWGGVAANVGIPAGLVVAGTALADGAFSKKRPPADMGLPSTAYLNRLKKRPRVSGRGRSKRVQTKFRRRRGAKRSRVSSKRRGGGSGRYGTKRKSFKKRVFKKGAVTQAPGFAGDLMTQRVTVGRRMSRARLAAKMSAVASQSLVLRYQNMTAYSALQGGIIMGRTLTLVPPATGSSETYPFFIFNLSNNGGWNNASTPITGYQMIRQWTTGAAITPEYNFTGVNGLDYTGTASNSSFQTEQTYLSVTSACNRSLLEWLDIRLDCIGPTSDYCKWVVQLVSFKEAYYCPEWVGQNNVDQLSLDAINSRVDFYDREIMPYITHPLNPRSYGVTNFVKQAMTVHWATEFVTASKDQNDLNTIGQERQIKLFKRMNRIQNYDWGDSRPLPPVAAGVDPVGWVPHTTTGRLQDDVEPKKRLYLIVKAQNLLTTAVGATTCPSFDIAIRAKHVVF